MNQPQAPTPRQLNSDAQIDADTPFRIRAGPGAGKTHWLINHIKDSLQHGKKLGPASLIGCISYTEIAATEIQRRLGDTGDRVDVSTIHSFLYRNIVRPYLHTLNNDEQFTIDTAQLNGHDDHHVSVGRYRAHAKTKKSFLLLKDDNGTARLKNCLKRLTWTLNNHDWTLSAQTKRPPLSLPAEDLMAYKQSYWNQGTIHHDDVLYFAHKILSKHPLLREMLSARYPYIFIDEFQDTTPAQTKIIEWLAACGTTIGVIGDPEQSIYEFTGARPQDFSTLAISSCIDYEIRGNRRSSNPIIHLLNTIRRDGLRQDTSTQTASAPVALYTGEQKNVLEAVRNTWKTGSYAILFRSNKEVRAARLGKPSATTSPWEELASVESNQGRQRLVRSLAEAHAYLNHHRIGTAAHILSKELRRLIHIAPPSLLEYHTRHLTITILEHLHRNTANFNNGSLLDFYSSIESALSSSPYLRLVKYGKGKPRLHAEKTPYSDLLGTTNVLEESNELRTIHRSKGAEFDSVLIWITQENLRRLIGTAPSSSGMQDDDEERRILYVAMSRARTNLAFGTSHPLNESDQAATRALGIKLIHIAPAQ